MSKRKSDPKRDALWAEAKRLCRLNAETVRMAKELGFNPRTLIKNIPSKSQQWKAPVHVWIRDLYGARQYEMSKGQAASQKQEPTGPTDQQSSAQPGSDRAKSATPFDLAGGDTPDRDAFGGTDAVFDSDEDVSSWARSEGFLERDPPVTIRSIQEQDAAMLRNQRNLRKAALAVTKAFQRLPEVDKVVLFGSVASPLKREVPRFRPFQREGVKILHECVDVDLAVWMSDLSRLNQLRKAQAQALNELMVKQNTGVAHHQVDVYLMDSATDLYLGRLCHFNECPKGKPECLVPGCGSSRFLRQFQNYDFRPSVLSPECSETLLDRMSLSPPDQDLPF